MLSGQIHNMAKMVTTLTSNSCLMLGYVQYMYKHIHDFTVF